MNRLLLPLLWWVGGLPGAQDKDLTNASNCIAAAVSNESNQVYNFLFFRFDGTHTQF